MDSRLSNRLESSAFKLGFCHGEFRLPDQGSGSDESIDAGDPLATEGKTAAVANKQTENHMISLVVGRARRS